MQKKLGETSINQTADQLLFWYYKQLRPYMWRTTTDPYKIWLSEVMLQQTRIETITPFYNRWILALPTMRAVSNTSIDNILKLWEGLGYYNRAKNFYKACQTIVNDYEGYIPQNFKEFQRLPGVGPYIAAAVMSIAFNISTPAVDINAIRVTSRLFMIKSARNKNKTKIYNKLLMLIDNNCPGDFNQAIMDLGRHVCTTNNPKCTICPINVSCLAYVNKSVNKYPNKLKKSFKPKYRVAVGIIWKNGQLLISKRQSHKLLGDMWEFPGGKIEAKETPQECILREIHEELDIKIKINAFIKTIQHSYSHFSITMDAYHCSFVKGVPKNIQCAEHKWILPEELEDLPFPSASHKLFDDIKYYSNI